MGDFELAQFKDAKMNYVSVKTQSQGAFARILGQKDFEDAYHEITSWQGYQPTPLYHLDDMAKVAGVQDVLYKDEGPRFGLASFKALGGAYAAIRVLQKQIEAKTGKPVRLSDIRDGKYQDDCASITLVSATDGNHGRSLSWGCQSRA